MNIVVVLPAHIIYCGKSNQSLQCISFSFSFFFFLRTVKSITQRRTFKRSSETMLVVKENGKPLAVLVGKLEIQSHLPHIFPLLSTIHVREAVFYRSDLTNRFQTMVKCELCQNQIVCSKDLSTKIHSQKVIVCKQQGEKKQHYCLQNCFIVDTATQKVL